MTSGDLYCSICSSQRNFFWARILSAKRSTQFESIFVTTFSYACLGSIVIGLNSKLMSVKLYPCDNQIVPANSLHSRLFIFTDSARGSVQFVHRHDLVHFHADPLSTGFCSCHEQRLFFLCGRGHRQQQSHGAVPGVALHVFADVADPHGHLIIK